MKMTDEQRIKAAGFVPNPTDGTWDRGVSDEFDLVLEQAEDDPYGEWWLTLAGYKDAPRMEFAGRLRQCLDVARKFARLFDERRLP